MILDKQALLSEDQALTTTAVSTNVIDMGADAAEIQAFIEKAGDLLVQVTEALESGTSVQVQVQVDDAEGFGSLVTLLETAAVVTADLITGYQFRLGALPPHTSKRYLRIRYLIVGTYDAGTVFAGFVNAKQTNGVA